jgi:hypothetical protein
MVIENEGPNNMEGFEHVTAIQMCKELTFNSYMEFTKKLETQNKHFSLRSDLVKHLCDSSNEVGMPPNSLCPSKSFQHTTSYKKSSLQQTIKKFILMNYGKANSNKLWKLHYDELYREIHSNELEHIVLMH